MKVLAIAAALALAPSATLAAICQADAITNGDFHLGPNGKPDPWVFSPATSSGSQNTSISFGEGYASLIVNNGQVGLFGNTSISQSIPGLCGGVLYNLTFTSQLSLSGNPGGMRGGSCSIYYSLDSIGRLVFIGPPNGDRPPFDKETRSYEFRYNGNGAPDKLTISSICTAPGANYTINSVHLVGSG
ncbi:MAG: hypothetical protein Q9212_002606 [Teloschistes hypoglaucus]